MQESTKVFVHQFFDKTSSSYDKIVAYCTFGKDRYWKNKICQYLPMGDSYLDLACGTGILTQKIAQQFPKSSVIGVDITLGYIELAKKKSPHKNISYIHKDAEEINFSQKFDCITASYLPKYCEPTVLVKKCKEHLKYDGKIIFHDFTCPRNTLVKALWEAYFVVLKFAGLFIPNWKVAFSKLPKLIKSTHWLTAYENELKKNGFNVKCFRLTLDSSAILIAQKSKRTTL